MADRMTKEQRHLCMSHIRSRDTGPELAVRKALFADGFRFRVNVSSLPGSPDIVLRKYNTVIFVHGCFWHGHSGCRLYTVPGSNTRFWEDKVARNRRRDAAVAVRLEARGWNIITIWECSLDAKHREKTLAGVEEHTLHALDVSDRLVVDPVAIADDKAQSRRAVGRGLDVVLSHAIDDRLGDACIIERHVVLSLLSCTFCTRVHYVTFWSCVNGSILKCVPTVVFSR